MNEVFDHINGLTARRHVSVTVATWNIEVLKTLGNCAISFPGIFEDTPAHVRPSSLNSPVMFILGNSTNLEILQFYTGTGGYSLRLLRSPAKPLHVRCLPCHLFHLSAERLPRAPRDWPNIP
jgi:hypothetical protein